MARTVMDSAKKIKIYTLYNEGVPTSSLAERFCLSSRHITNIVREMKAKDGKN